MHWLAGSSFHQIPLQIASRHIRQNAHRHDTGLAFLIDGSAVADSNQTHHVGMIKVFHAKTLFEKVFQFFVTERAAYRLDGDRRFAVQGASKNLAKISCRQKLNNNNSNVIC